MLTRPCPSQVSRPLAGHLLPTWALQCSLGPEEYPQAGRRGQGPLEGYTGAMLARSMGQHRAEGKFKSLGADLNHHLGLRAPGTPHGEGLGWVLEQQPSLVPSCPQET